MTNTITEQLVEFALGSEWERLASGAREAATATTGNVLALAAGGAAHPAVDRTVRALAALGAGPRVPVLGRSESLTPTWAALVHGLAAHVEDYDDTHPSTVVHPGAPIVPAALAGAQISGASGREVLTAVAVGTEVALRLGLALTPHAMERGWHMTGVVGGVGAAVAAGRTLGLSPRQLRHALGFAATQSSGLLEALGTMTKPLHPGKAASQGVEAALFARAGLDGPAAPLEGRRGLLALLRPGVEGIQDTDASLLTNGLGSLWELESNEIKPYACGVVSHPIIDLARELRAETGADRAVSEVRLDVHPLVPSVMGRLSPTDGLESKFSAVHCFAVGLVRDGGGPEDFTDAAAVDPALAVVRERCTLNPDPGLGRYAVRARIVTEEGTVLERTVDGARRLDAAQVRDKARALAAPVLGDAHEEFVDTVFGLEKLEDVSRVTEIGRAALASR
ncbi:MmgE/PrpD family protein [Nocardiopsis sp. MG754419]|uniref:MmgE/PrpD family protein n=1 Tax=Nocardiopsis sp. MG754419 TaxID=2259865 RepID=UPI001BAE025F|nr:MmgE/PrpD family protein [Nocardiopsis sp. MG754419]MBR8741798.1 MmgE/PrpD family protein [Nocardiopsis sp. MG754419]